MRTNNYSYGSSSLYGALSWQIAEKLLSQGLGIVIQIILARILLPEDFASLAIISAIVNYLGIFVQSGLSTAIIRKKELTAEDVSTLTICSLVVAVFFYFLLFYAADLIETYYSVGSLKWPIRVLSISLIFYSFNAIQSGLLTRLMKFKTIFIRSAITIPFSGLIAIIMALRGYGIWALVVYELSKIVLTVLIMNLIPQLRIQMGFSISSAKELYSFSYKILLTNIVSGASDMFRTMTIGKFFSPAMLAFYDKGYTYSRLITSVIAQSISSVVLPKLASKQDDMGALLFASRRTVRMASFVMMPILVFCVFIAKPLVILLLTEKWEPCVPFLMLFCIFRLPGLISSTDKQAYYALGKSQIGLLYEVILLIVNLISLFVFVHISIISVAISATVIEIFANIFMWYISSRVYGYGLKERFLDMVKPFIGTICIATIGFLLLKLNLNNLLFIFVYFATSFVVYSLSSMILKDSSMMELVRKIKIRS